MEAGRCLDARKAARAASVAGPGAASASRLGSRLPHISRSERSRRIGEKAAANPARRARRSASSAEPGAQALTTCARSSRSNPRASVCCRNSASVPFADNSSARRGTRTLGPPCASPSLPCRKRPTRRGGLRCGLGPGAASVIPARAARSRNSLSCPSAQFSHEWPSTEARSARFFSTSPSSTRRSSSASPTGNSTCGNSGTQPTGGAITSVPQASASTTHIGPPS